MWYLFLSLNMKEGYVYDYETIKNTFVAVYINIYDKSIIKKFEISPFQNDLKSLIKFYNHLIDNNIKIISFNGLAFDYQVTTYIIENVRTFDFNSGELIANSIFNFVQQLFKIKNEKGYTIYSPNNNPFNEIDVAAINNYNNQQKFASLKWIQFNMDWPNIIDMNCEPTDELNQKQIMQLSVYCINDCLSTFELFKKNLEQVKVRKDLTKYFGINLQNLSEPKLVKAILGNLLSTDLDMPEAILKTKRTFRKTIYLVEAILPYIKFKTKPLIETLSKFKSLQLDAQNLKGSFAHKIMYRGLEFSFALGGIHGAKRGLYKQESDMIIKSFDVKSYYPNLCIRNKWSPAHIDAEIFCKRYEWFYNERLKYPKDNPLNYLYKIILNSAFGLSNDDNSFLKDGFLTMQITCNGQLLLVQLMEELCEEIPGARPIMINTDGGEIILPKEYESKYFEICKKWEEQTSLVLEFENYQKLIIWDVNNYIGIFKPVEISKEDAIYKSKNEFPKPLIKKKDNKYYYFSIKLKGRFEIDKALHKNKSYRIKAIAIYNYFVHGIDPKKTIRNDKNIYNFCAGVRAKKGWKFINKCVKKGELGEEALQKTVRYYISNSGCKIIKKNTNTEQEIKVEATSNIYEEVAIKIDNTIPIEKYELNYSHYEKLVRSEIETVEPFTTQNKLF